MFSFSFKTF